MIQNKKYIIFDWNGTLVNDAWIFVDILNVLLDSRGLNKININQYREKFCFPIKLFYDELGVDTSDTSFKNLEIEFVKEYNQRKHAAKLFDNLEIILEMMVKNGKSLSILSASNQKILHDLVKFYNIANLFNRVAGVNNYGAHGKLEAGTKLISQLNCQNKDIVLIGDTDHDFEIAAKLEIDCILISHGHQSRERLKLLSNNVIGGFEELLLP